MATLAETGSTRKVHLRPLHVFGRHPDRVDSVIHSADVSQVHASIRWAGCNWEIVDHSRNGTARNGRRISAGAPETLAVGDRLEFGTSSGWQVIDLGPPGPMLLSLHNGQEAIELKDFLLLPDDSAPEGSLYRLSNCSWVWEDDGGCRIVQDGADLLIGAQWWRFSLPSALERTLDSNRARNDAIAAAVAARFEFCVSQNEEHVELTVQCEGTRVHLGERSHHYALLTLARRRVADGERGIDSASQGWLDVDRLASMLGMDAAHLNIQLFRARKQIAAALPLGPLAVAIIERRRGQVRFGPYVVRIIRGTREEAHFDPALPGLATLPYVSLGAGHHVERA
jgi:hypothetical protein